MSEVALAHQPCPSCGSSDAMAVYTDGHTYCFSCEKHTNAPGTARPATPARKVSGLLQNVYYAAITEWGGYAITEETCRRYRYGLYDGANGKTVHVAEYRNQEGDICAQHVRTPGKLFPWHGDHKRVQLFGQHLFEPNPNNSIGLTITEGEKDTLHYAQAGGLRWPVVSLPNGAQAAERAIRDNIDWISRWPHVEIMFDNDEPGREAAKKVAALLPPGKAKIVSLPLKDAADMCQTGRVSELLRARLEAKVWRPDGIVGPDEILARIRKPRPKGIPFPWLSDLNEWTGGFGQEPMLIMLTAGTGTGKTTFMRSLETYLLNLGHRVGVFHLEESLERAALGIIGYEMGVPLTRLERPAEVVGFEEAAARVGLGADGRLFIDDHFGATDIDTLLPKIRDYVVREQCAFVFLDHLSMLTSGVSDNEKTVIDGLLSKLRPLIQELGITVFAASHLRRLEGNRGHEDGMEVRLSHLRGSGSIAQNSDMVIAFERDQQNADRSLANIIRVRLLKNRHGTGEVGLAGELVYDNTTGRLAESESFNSAFSTPAAGEPEEEACF